MTRPQRPSPTVDPNEKCVNCIWCKLEPEDVYATCHYHPPVLWSNGHEITKSRPNVQYDYACAFFDDGESLL